ncbi:MAG TPA: hypothetical protein VG755_36280 [Nannocystaceae bacterium]|nr:hypothetical protein [Nannocystaceae bacterium]
MSDDLKRGRWRTAPRPAVREQGYRKPAPDRDDRSPPSLEQSGHYQALREHWLTRLWRWLTRSLRS